MIEEIKTGISGAYKELEYIHIASDYETVLKCVYDKNHRIYKTLLSCWIDLDIITHDEFSELESFSDELAELTTEKLHR